MAAKLLQVETLPSGNKHLPAPLSIGEKVIVMEDIEENQYIKVRHNKGQNFSWFNRLYFTSHLTTVINKEKQS